MDIDREKAIDLLFSMERVDSGWLEEFRGEEATDPNWILLCEEVVRERYRKDDAAKDGYGRIAWALRELDRPKDALGFFTRDWEEHRMGRWQFLRFVETFLLAEPNGKAEELVEEYYASYPEAKDGWAVLALHHKSAGNVETARSLFRRDYDLGRITFPFWRDWIELEWDNGNFDKFVELVVQLYEADEAAINVFLSYGVRAFRRGDQILAARLFLLEKESIRVVPKDIVGNIWSILGAASDEENVREWLEYFNKYLFTHKDVGNGLSRLKLVEILLNYGWRDIAIEIIEFGEGVDQDLLRGNAKHLIKRPRSIDADAFDRSESRLTQLLEGADVDRRLVAGYVRSSMKRVYRDFNFLKEHIDPEERIVDIGCTPPLMLSLLSEAGFHNLTAIDPSADRYASFFHRSKIEFFCSGAGDMPIQRLLGAVDVLCMCEVIEHLAVDVAPVLHAAKAVIRKGGKLYVTTPNLRSVSGLYALVCKQSGLASKANEQVRDQLDRVNSNHKYYGHIREYTSKELVDLVESFGFRLVEKRMSTFSLLHRKYPMFLLLLEKLFPSWRLFGAYLFEKVSDV